MATAKEVGIGRSIWWVGAGAVKHVAKPRLDVDQILEDARQKHGITEAEELGPLPPRKPDRLYVSPEE